MKFFYLFCFLLLSFSGFSQSNCSECDKIKIVGVYDFLASPQTPGGNYILLLLTLSEDLSPGFNTFYVDIFFIDSNGDTLTQPTGENQTLPTLKGDTIPYLLNLRFIVPNQDFPKNFDGKLVLNMSNVAPCPQKTTCEIPFKKISFVKIPEEPGSEISLYPNPAKTHFNFYAEKAIQKINLFDTGGKLVKEVNPVWPETSVAVSNFSPGTYLVRFEFEDGIVVWKRLIKVG
ncbi:MAG: T9SS type A sorting domain-containing protein [Saprospiraceae bacterium]